MKRVFYVLIVLLLAFPLFGQNTDKNTKNISSQEIDYETFETTIDAIRNTFVPAYTTTSVSIDSNGTVSDSVDLKDNRVIGFVPDTAWTTATITFKTWNPVTSEWVNLIEDDGTEMSFTFNDSSFTAVTPTKFAGVRYLKVRSGTSGTPVAQKYSHKHVGIILRRY